MIILLHINIFGFGSGLDIFVCGIGDIWLYDNMIGKNVQMENNLCTGYPIR